MEIAYRYKVYRKEFNVFYDVMRNDDIVSSKSLGIFDLPFLQYMMSGVDTEKTVEKLFIVAHKRGRKAIDDLLKYET